MRRLVTLIFALLAPLLLGAALPAGSPALTLGSLGQIQHQLQSTNAKIHRKKGAERVLTSDISRYNQRIGSLTGRIETLQQRENRIQAELDRRRTELVAVQADLRGQRSRLVRLRLRLAQSRRALAQRLVDLYQADQADLMTVILSSHGFAELLERGEFLQRISEADRRIVTAVSVGRSDAAATSTRLAGLEARKKEVAAAILARRDAVAQIKGQVVGTRAGAAQTREDKRRALTKVGDDRQRLESEAVALEAASRRVQAKLAGIANGGGPPGLPAGPIKQGGGQLIWPINGPITGQFGEQRPGHIHAGVDISAPEGTPIRAAGDGKVTLLQGVGESGGYGNYTCINHTTSLSTCYAHQSRFGTSLGASVSKGDVIGYVGNTGHSFGAHLHFEVRVNGVPTQPLNYL